MDKENHPNLIEDELEEPEPRYIEGLAKLMKRKSPWEDKA